jgi:serine/threonine protein kinase
VLQRAAKIDEKADIWSIGVLMYVLLSGRHPFDTAVALDEQEVERSIMYKVHTLYNPHTVYPIPSTLIA